MTQTRTTEDLITEYRTMIAADTEHLTRALAHGDRTEAHLCTDSIIDIQHRIEDLTA